MQLREILDLIQKIEKDGIVLIPNMGMGSTSEEVNQEAFKAAKQALDGIDDHAFLALSVVKILLIYGNHLNLPANHWLTMIAPIIDAPHEMIGLAMMAEQQEKSIIVPSVPELQVDGVQDSMNRLRTMMGGGFGKPGKG